MGQTLQQKANSLAFATVNIMLRDRFRQALNVHSLLFYYFAICNRWKTEFCNRVTLRSYF